MVMAKSACCTAWAWGSMEHSSCLRATWLQLKRHYHCHSKMFAGTRAHTVVCPYNVHNVVSVRIRNNMLASTCYTRFDFTLHRILWSTMDHEQVSGKTRTLFAHMLTCSPLLNWWTMSLSWYFLKDGHAFAPGPLHLASHLMLRMSLLLSNKNVLQRVQSLRWLTSYIPWIKFRYVPLCGQHGRDFMRQQVASAHLFKLICSFPAHGDRPARTKMLPNLFKSGDAPNSCSCVNMLGVRQECELSKALRCSMC